MKTKKFPTQAQPPQVITEADVALALEQLRQEREERELLERKLAEYEAVKAEEKSA